MTKSRIIAIISLIIFIIIFSFIIRGILAYPEFKRQLRYLNSEIHRTSGNERKHWKRRKRRHIKRYFRSIFSLR